MASKLHYELRKICLCEFNEATQLKTSLAKYSIEFNDLAVQMRTHRIAYLRLLGRSLYITVCEKVCGQTTWKLNTTNKRNKIKKNRN